MLEHQCYGRALPTMYGTDMRIVPLGSGGAILDLHLFLKYRDIKLAIEVKEIEEKDDLLAYCRLF
jgi:hypothetical protein